MRIPHQTNRANIHHPHGSEAAMESMGHYS
jgi:hypothetical protein